MQFLKLGILLIVFFSLSTCKKDRVWVEHETFDCCNPWGDFNPEASMEELVTSFFEQNDIPVFEVRIEDRGREAICSICCKCPTNTFVGMLIDSEDLGKAAELNFFEEE